MNVVQWKFLLQQVAAVCICRFYMTCLCDLSAGMVYYFGLLALTIFGLDVSYAEVPPLLIVSLDGFRYDYLRVVRKFGVETPNFNRLIAEGVSIKDPGLTNVFVTKTLPNHYSMVTGLYAESHGIVSNTFFDPEFNEIFDRNSSMNIKWWNGTGVQKVEPIWLTNEAADVQRSSGVYFWPGCDIVGQQPKYFASSFGNSSVPFEVRIDQIVSWFSQKSDPISFGALYLNEPDNTGHSFGPETKQVAEVVAKIDKGIGRLLEALESKNLLGKMNIIVTSDHGMERINDTSVIYLDQYVDPRLFRSFAGSPVTHILPGKGSYLSYS